MLLLVVEVALVISLRAFGWHATNNGMLWILCLLCAALPLVSALVALLRDRFRFGSRTLLVATTLIAAFLYLTIMPLHRASRSRRASQALLATGATLRTASSWDSVYQHLAYDPRPAPYPAPHDNELSSWLRPLAGNLLKIPRADAVREIWLSGDIQVETLCYNAAEFPNLERLDIGGVSPAAMESLKQAIPSFARLGELKLDLDLPKNWFRSLRKIHTLSLWAEQNRAGRKISVEQLRDLAALSDLKVLDIFLYAVTDADVKVLSTSTSLKRLLLKKTAVTAAGAKQLSTEMPGCVVYPN